MYKSSFSFIEIRNADPWFYLSKVNGDEVHHKNKFYYHNKFTRKNVKLLLTNLAQPISTMFEWAFVEEGFISIAN